MGEPESRVRLFIGIYPPRQLVGELVAGLPGLGLPPHRLVPPDQIHLTVHFVGPVRKSEVDRVRETLERAASGISTFELVPERLVALPPRGPRLIAAETTLPPELAELQRRVSSRLASKLSGRAYLPHVTLCRFTGRGPGGLEPVALDLPAFAVGEVCLMRSVLRPEGAEHHLLGRVRLARP